MSSNYTSWARVIAESEECPKEIVRAYSVGVQLLNDKRKDFVDRARFNDLKSIREHANEIAGISHIVHLLAMRLATIE